VGGGGFGIWGLGGGGGVGGVWGGFPAFVERNDRSMCYSFPPFEKVPAHSCDGGKCFGSPENELLDQTLLFSGVEWGSRWSQVPCVR